MHKSGGISNLEINETAGLGMNANKNANLSGITPLNTGILPNQSPNIRDSGENSLISNS
mgnify:CR=1 FL=1